MIQNTVIDIRREFVSLFRNRTLTRVDRESTMTSIVGHETIEIVNASFIADEDSIFGKVDVEYAAREEAWYRSMSLNVNDIPGGAPTVWKAVASSDGTINSNYGWCVFSDENNSQFDKVVSELKKNSQSRRAVIIYTRPSIWNEFNVDGRSDFICTNVVQYLIRDDAVHAVVQMRSSDAVYGYKTDYHWQRVVLQDVANALSCDVGNVYWNAGSLHVYARHFYLVDHYQKTGEHTIPKKKYDALYGDDAVHVCGV